MASFQIIGVYSVVVGHLIRAVYSWTLLSSPRFLNSSFSFWYRCLFTGRHAGYAVSLPTRVCVCRKGGEGGGGAVSASPLLPFLIRVFAVLGFFFFFLSVRCTFFFFLRRYLVGPMTSRVSVSRWNSEAGFSRNGNGG